MKIVFYPQSLLPFHAKSLDERPLGGTETGAIRLAEALHKMGHQVVVFTSEKNPPPSEPPYFHLSAAQKLRPVDVFICIREWIPLVSQIPTRSKFLWTGDSYDQPHNLGIGDKRVAAIVNGLLTVSEWHADTLAQNSGFPREKCFAIRNGIHAPFFEGTETRVPKRLIYSSTPYRGLELLPGIFERVRKTHPDATLEIFSGFDVYRGKQEYNPAVQQRYQPLFDKLKTTPGVTLHGNIPQGQLAREFMKSSVLAYPNVFEETSCITAIEAMAAGCIPVCTALGALPETVGSKGHSIAGDPRSETFADDFSKKICDLLSSPNLETERERIRKETLRDCSWDAIAQRFTNYLESKLSADNS